VPVCQITRKRFGQIIHGVSNWVPSGCVAGSIHRRSLGLQQGCGMRKAQYSQSGQRRNGRRPLLKSRAWIRRSSLSWSTSGHGAF
jgi:hypothetical protein